MKQDDLSNEIFTGIRLSDAVGSGNGAEVRKISSEIDFHIIQENATQIFIHAIFLLNRLDRNDFPNDVWNELPKFLIEDVKDRSVILGCSEDLLHGMVGTFLQQNIGATLSGEKVLLLNPEAYAGGYFHVSAAMGEAIFGLLKTMARIRFDGNYKNARKMLIEYIQLQLAVAEDDEQQF